MSVQDRVATLRERHAELEAKLEDEQSHPHPDEAAIAEIKKQKLRIKDELAGLNAV